MKVGRGKGTGSGDEANVRGNEAVSFASLPFRKLRNDEARSEHDEEDGKILGVDRDRRESRQDHSFLG